MSLHPWPLGVGLAFGFLATQGLATYRPLKDAMHEDSPHDQAPPAVHQPRACPVALAHHKASALKQLSQPIRFKEIGCRAVLAEVQISAQALRWRVPAGPGDMGLVNLHPLLAHYLPKHFSKTPVNDESKPS